MIKEVTVFSNGDSAKLNTWSNVPYFFTETLLKNGVKVNRVNISPSKFWESKFNKFIVKNLKKVYPQTTFEYFRSYFHYYWVSIIVISAFFKYRKSDKYVFLTFSFSTFGLPLRNVVQFCDWTYDYYFKYFLDRNPDIFEKIAVKREFRQMRRSSMVIPLFKTVHDYLTESCSLNNLRYISNVINNNYPEVSVSDLIDAKTKSNKILFVGSIKYIHGARKLIAAFNSVKKNYTELELHIIGMDDTDLGNLPDRVFCYGYLSKDDPDQNKIYYNLFINSMLYVNPTPKWSAFSATIEAMYYCMPVLVAKYPEFVSLFGEDTKSIYYDENTDSSIIDTLVSFLDDSDKRVLYLNARNIVKEHTWENFIDNFLKMH